MITVLKYSLSNSQDLFTEYQQLLGTQSGPINNAKILNLKKIDLENKLRDITADVNTLNTEFDDRSSVKRFSKLETLGLTSRQDWILLIFFVSYALLSIVILTYSVIYTEPQQRIKAALVVILISAVLGIMTGGVIKYYA
jgi:hypothetical protein